MIESATDIVNECLVAIGGKDEEIKKLNDEINRLKAQLQLATMSEKNSSDDNPTATPSSSEEPSFDDNLSINDSGYSNNDLMDTSMDDEETTDDTPSASSGTHEESTNDNPSVSGVEALMNSEETTDDSPSLNGGEALMGSEEVTTDGNPSAADVDSSGNSDNIVGASLDNLPLPRSKPGPPPPPVIVANGADVWTLLVQSTTEGRSYRVTSSTIDVPYYELCNIDQVWLHGSGGMLPIGDKIMVTLPSSYDIINDDINLNGGCPTFLIEIVLYKRGTPNGGYHKLICCLPSTTVSELTGLSLLGENVTKSNLVLTLGPLMLLYHPNEKSTDTDLELTLADYNVANKDTIAVLSVEQYSDSLSAGKVPKPIDLQHPNENLRGNYRLEMVVDGQGIIRHFEAVRDDVNGTRLFSRSNVLVAVTQMMKKIYENKNRFYQYYDEDNVLRDQILEGDAVGNRVMAFLKLVHQNSCSPTGPRQFMKRYIMYKTFPRYGKDYHGELNRVIEFLSIAIRIRVGDEFVSIPERAFGVKAETDGSYDGKLSFEFKLHGRVVGTFDCNDIVNQANNAGGYKVPQYYLMGRSGIEHPVWFDEVVMRSNAHCVLVVEDGCTFNLLRQVKFCDRFPCIIVCPHGLPDHETVAFVHMLTATLGIEAYGVADFNKGGVRGLHKFGSKEQGLFNTKLRWIGLRPCQLNHLTTSNHLPRKSLLDIINCAKKTEDGETPAESKPFSEKSQKEIQSLMEKWVENGGTRSKNRQNEMMHMQEIGYGIDLQKADDDQLVGLILRSLVDIWSQQDCDRNNLRWT
eukprot:scaffold5206_cov78-Skeletonema_dohrnii-CCMP3373.AAC.5